MFSIRIHLPLVLITCASLGAACKKNEASPQTGVSRSTQTTITAPSGGTLSGKILLKDEFKSKVSATDTIFVIARKGPSGPPLAVKKLAPAAFPMAYTLTASDVMMPGAAFEGQVEVTVRIDKDGDAMSKNPGDLFGKTASPVEVGGGSADVTVDKAIP